MKIISTILSNREQFKKVELQNYSNDQLYTNKNQLMANVIQWDNDKYSVKINSIDEQHKKLVELTNILFNAIIKEEGYQNCASMISELVKYTQFHFSTEEEYFKKFAYPQIVEHINEHTKLIEQIR